MDRWLRQSRAGAILLVVLAAAGSWAAVACPRLYRPHRLVPGSLAAGRIVLTTYKGRDDVSADACLCGITSVRARPAMCPAICATKPRPGVECASTDVRERSVARYCHYIWDTGLMKISVVDM